MSYERTVFSLLDLFGNLGGINEILQIAGGLLVGIYADHLFFYSLFGRIYQVQTESKDNSSNTITTKKSIKELIRKKSAQVKPDTYLSEENK